MVSPAYPASVRTARAASITVARSSPARWPGPRVLGMDKLYTVQLYWTLSN